MKRYFILLLALGACTTPETILKSRDGNYVTCGGSSVGSSMGGYIGYSIEKDMDDKCVQDYTSNGYSVIKKVDKPSIYP